MDYLAQVPNDVVAVLGCHELTSDGRKIKYFSHNDSQEVTIALVGIPRKDRKPYHAKLSIALGMRGYSVQAMLPKTKMLRATRANTPSYADTIVMLWDAAQGWQGQLNAPELGLSLVCVTDGFAVFGEPFRRAEAARQGQEHSIRVERHRGYDVWRLK